MNVAAEDEVRLVGRLAGGLAPLAPLPLQGERAEHDRLGGALRAGPGGLARGVEQLGEHPDAALLDVERLRVLGVIDEVAVQILVDHPARLGLHPGRDEGGEVALRDPLHGKLLVDQAHRRDRHHRLLGDFLRRGRLGEKGAGLPHLDGLEVAHAAEPIRIGVRTPAD